MAKIKLDFNDLQVESFDTTPGSEGSKEGTVVGLTLNEDTSAPLVLCTCTTQGQSCACLSVNFSCNGTCDTCANSCGGTCSTCGSTCGGTCGSSCGGTCNTCQATCGTACGGTGDFTCGTACQLPTSPLEIC